jgi:hypothetical protein
LPQQRRAVLGQQTSLAGATVQGAEAGRHKLQVLSFGLMYCVWNNKRYNNV